MIRMDAGADHRALVVVPAQLVAAACRVAGRRHVELAEVVRAAQAFRAEVQVHLIKEERVLFPMIRELASSTTAPEFHCGTLANPISVMMSEYDRAGSLLEHLAVLTDDFTVPDDGCASYRALYAGLRELTLDTHLHVHKGNNLLFPMVLEAEQRVAGRTVAP